MSPVDHVEPEDPPLLVSCPGCDCELEVDRRTGKVLAHRPKVSAPADFEDLFDEVERSKQRAERRVAQEEKALADRRRLLDRQFEDAMARAEEVDDSTPPESPFDLD